MLPGKTDPRWRNLVEHPEQFKDKVTALPCRILLSGFSMKIANSSVEETINAAYDFFVKNEKIVSTDIESIFS